ncbi:MAG: S16 family serine protease [Sulfobacillus sp.]
MEDFCRFRSLLKLKEIYLARRKIARQVRQRLDSLERTLLSVSANADMRLRVDPDNWTLMDSIAVSEKLRELTASVQNFGKVTFGNARDQSAKSLYLEYRVCELAKKYGVPRISALVALLSGGAELSQAAHKELSYLDDVFFPCSAEIKPGSNDDPETQILPDAEKGKVLVRVRLPGSFPDVALPARRNRICEVRGAFRTGVSLVETAKKTAFRSSMSALESELRKLTEVPSEHRIAWLFGLSLADLLCRPTEKLVDDCRNSYVEHKPVPPLPKPSSAPSGGLGGLGGLSGLARLRSLPDWITQRLAPDVGNYEERIKSMNCPESVKRKAAEKLKEVRSKEDNAKAEKYLNGLLSIPFGVYRKEPLLRFLEEFRQRHVVSGTYSQLEKQLPALAPSAQTEFAQYRRERTEFIAHCRRTLDCIHGQEKAKDKIVNLLAQWINGQMTGNVLGFVGAPGVGKTSLAKFGLAKCLTDAQGLPRPFVLVPLGGSTNGSTLEGHGYTYVGSKWGRIVDVLMDSGCMNPIIYFDELDKISDTAHGREIAGILTHLTDPSQNDEFEDRYFDGVKLDLSKALLIFSYNDRDALDPVLRDRIQEIEFENLTKSEKLHIAEKYLLPRICTEAGYLPEDIRFPREVLEGILDRYVYEAGVRKLKEKLTVLVQDFNMRIISGGQSLPMIVDAETVDDVLGRSQAIDIRMVSKVPRVGMVNGLYASKVGVGGLSVIEVSRTVTADKFSLEVTGNLGDVMKESVRYARTVVWGILPESLREKLSGGFHIHCPAAGTPKEGPSAGMAITLAIVSLVTGIPVRPDCAMTGEIDLGGNIRRIGGLPAKLEGAFRAGVKLVIIPRENEPEFQEMARGKLADFGSDFKVVAVQHVTETLRLALTEMPDWLSEEQEVAVI